MEIISKFCYYQIMLTNKRTLRIFWAVIAIFVMIGMIGMLFAPLF
ncbi:MAG: hypothetical protein AAB638_00345 [Patescibacteria group bacterium]